MGSMANKLKKKVNGGKKKVKVSVNADEIDAYQMRRKTPSFRYGDIRRVGRICVSI